MEKPFRLILFVLLAVVVINLVLNMSGRSHINDVIKHLEKSQRNIDSAIGEIQTSRNRLDSIQVDLTKFKYYIKDIQQTVALMDLEKKLKEITDRNTLDSLRLKRISLKKSLEVNDSLPPLIVKRL